VTTSFRSAGPCRRRPLLLPNPTCRPPARAPAAPNPGAPNPGAGLEVPAARVAIDRDDLARRLTQALASRPALAGLPIELTVRNGTAFLSGRVPSVYEAMLASARRSRRRACARLTTGSSSVVPDGEGKNPLQQL